MKDKIKSVKAIKGTHLLNVTFEDNKNFIVDMYDEIYQHVFLEKLLNREIFQKVKIAGFGWVIAWDDKLDYSGEELRKLAEKQAKTKIIKLLKKVVNE